QLDRAMNYPSWGRFAPTVLTDGGPYPRPLSQARERGAGLEGSSARQGGWPQAHQTGFSKPGTKSRTIHVSSWLQFCQVYLRRGIRVPAPATASPARNASTPGSGTPGLPLVPRKVCTSSISMATLSETPKVLTEPCAIPGMNPGFGSESNCF